MNFCIQNFKITQLQNGDVKISLGRKRLTPKIFLHRKDGLQYRLKRVLFFFNSQENEKPFGHTDGEEEDDEEVFFGIVTTKEKSKMVKLRRKTQLFVSNFRDMLSEGSDESISLLVRSFP